MVVVVVTAVIAVAIVVIKVTVWSINIVVVVEMLVIDVRADVAIDTFAGVEVIMVAVMVIASEFAAPTPLREFRC